MVARILDSSRYVTDLYKGRARGPPAPPFAACAAAPALRPDQPRTRHVRTRHLSPGRTAGSRSGSLMKLSLVVAQGVHAGKVIPVTSTEFVIGRDPQWQLRPASPAISKQHCALTTRGDKVFVRDCGSTNGTFINDEQVAGEREAKTGDKLKVGPLEFEL